MVDLLSLIGDCPLLRMVKAVDAVHHNGLASAVGAYDGMNFALSNFQVYTRQSRNFTERHVKI
jgi:hypothetical protein